MKRRISREEYRRSCLFLLLVFCVGSGCGCLLGCSVSVHFVKSSRFFSFDFSDNRGFLLRTISISLFPLLLIFADLTGKRGLVFPAFFCKGFLLCFSSVCLFRWTDADLLRLFFYRFLVQNLLILLFSFCVASSLFSADTVRRGNLMRRHWLLLPFTALLSLLAAIGL